MKIKLGQRLTIKAIHPFAKINATREVVVTDTMIEGFLGTDDSGNVHFFDESMIVAINNDGWYYVADIATVDGNPWVCEAEFLEIVKELLGE